MNFFRRISQQLGDSRSKRGVGGPRGRAVAPALPAQLRTTQHVRASSPGKAMSADIPAFAERHLAQFRRVPVCLGVGGDAPSHRNPIVGLARTAGPWGTARRTEAARTTDPLPTRSCCNPDSRERSRSPPRRGSSGSLPETTAKEPSSASPALESTVLLASADLRRGPPAFHEPVDRTGPTRLVTSGVVVHVGRPASGRVERWPASQWGCLAAPEWRNCTLPCDD